jgi:hypothetical protein
MSDLLAEIKKRGKQSKTFKVFSIKGEIYSLPTDLENKKEYDPNYLLEDDEWFHIPNFKSSEYSLDILKIPFSPSEYNQINSSQLKKLNYLIAHQKNGENHFFNFQKIRPSQFLKNSWVNISGTPTFEKKKPIIIINDIPDAIYSVENDTLYFKRLTSISSIFIGISNLYRQATDEETESFLNNDFIHLDSNYSTENVGLANRKRIAMAIDTLNTFEDNEKRKIFDYIKEYCNDIPYDDEHQKFTINNEARLKKLLWGIEQRYYTTIVGSERRIANSVARIGE